jgi:hypothetical protein
MSDNELDIYVTTRLLVQHDSAYASKDHREA